MPEPKRTPLFSRHVELGGRMVEFAGYSLPVQYESIIAEHNHTREHVSLFDTSHMGQLLITGQSAAVKLSSAVTQDAEKLPVGRGKYGFILNDAGGIIDDTILMRLGEEEFLLIVNAATCENDIAVLQQRGLRPEMEYLAGWAKLDVQGPESFTVLRKFVDMDLSYLKYFGVTRCKVNGHDAVVSRTGYTGELGYEIFTPADRMGDLFGALLEVPGVKPAGLGARDSLRLEMCYPLYGHELSQDINPIQADMGVFLDASRRFVGSAALSGASSTLVALAGESRRQFHPGDEIFAGDEKVGAVTSGAFSPSLNVAIGMGYVDNSAATVGSKLTVKTARAELPVTVNEKPMYRNGTCRAQIKN